MHRRAGPPDYRFAYRYWAILADLDRLPELRRRSGLVQHNRKGVVALHDADHGPRDGSPLRPWFDQVLADADLDLAGGPAWLLTQPRVFGVGFNPLSLWFGWHRDGRLLAVLAEVRNTFGDWHGYLLHENGAPLGKTIRSRATKCFHVSPFFPVAGQYDFRIRLDEQRLGIGIHYSLQDAPLLTAVQAGTRQPLTRRHLLKAMAGPLPGSAGTLAAIHWQALKIWLRGGRYHARPQSPAQTITDD